MSKITLTGNASGTGTFTIASPNSNSDRTVNLPDAGGDMVLTTATQTLTNKTLTTPTINSAQFATVTGTAPIYPCRAWVNFEGSSTIIRGSGNISSVSRTGTGAYTVNYTTAMPDANYMAATGPVAIGSGAGSLELTGYNTTSISMITRYAPGGAFDWATVFIAIFR